MVTQHLLDDVFALPLADRMELLERLRENLESESRHSPLPEATRELLDRRLAAFERDEEAGSSWEDVATRIHERLANH